MWNKILPPSEVRYLSINNISGVGSKNLFILRLQTDLTKKITFLGFKDISVAECAF